MRTTTGKGVKQVKCYFVLYNAKDYLQLLHNMPSDDAVKDIAEEWCTSVCPTSLNPEPAEAPGAAAAGVD